MNKPSFLPRTLAALVDGCELRVSRQDDSLVIDCEVRSVRQTCVFTFEFLEEPAAAELIDKWIAEVVGRLAASLGIAARKEADDE